MKVELCALILLIIPFVSSNAEKIDPFDTVIEDIVPLLFNQRPDNENGTDSRFEYYALHDESNEELGHYTMQQIVARSGFKYKNHLVTSKDGYISQIIRIINPLADKRRLKQPPIMLLHGGIIDPTAYVWASAIQHHPEKYPRLPSDGPITSWNRSLAFMLSNDGWDVWLIGTRGSDSQNQGHVKYKGPKSIDLSGKSRPEDPVQAAIEAEKYWDFSMDEVIKYELPKQVDTVLEITGASNVTMFSFSLSTMTVPPFVAKFPDYADKVHNMIVLAPIINNREANNLILSSHAIFASTPEQIGTAVISEVLLTRFTRAFLLNLNTVRYIRYTIVKLLTVLLTGPSAKYRTLLEPAVIGHILMPLSFKLLKHYAQQVIKSRLQMYDYGSIKNEQVYGRIRPPKYSISNLNVKNWLLISASNDNLATPPSVRQFLREANPKPYQHIIAKNFNHLDLVAAFENDISVNFPVMNFLNRFRLRSRSKSHRLK